MGKRGQGAVNIELASLPLVGDQEWEGHSASPAMYLRDVYGGDHSVSPAISGGPTYFPGQDNSRKCTYLISGM